MKIALKAQSVGVTLAKKKVLAGVDAQIKSGSWTSIVGPNGAGKSTLLKALAGLLPFEGSIALHGRPLSDWPAKERARKVAWLGQSSLGQTNQLAYDLVMLGRMPHLAWLATPSSHDEAIVKTAMQRTQCWDLRHKCLRHLSGGECQRVLLARVLAVDADTFLMDEPLANLDPPHQADWIMLIRELTAMGKTVVSVLHELSAALQADSLMIMAAGMTVYQGDSSDSQTDLALEQVFDRRIRVIQSGQQKIAVFSEL